MKAVGSTGDYAEGGARLQKVLCCTERDETGELGVEERTKW